MPNPFANRQLRPSDPAVTAFDIVPTDSTDLIHMTTGLNVATPGTVRVTTIDDRKDPAVLGRVWSVVICLFGKHLSRK